MIEELGWEYDIYSHDPDEKQSMEVNNMMYRAARMTGGVPQVLPLQPSLIAPAHGTANVSLFFPHNEIEVIK